jgi:hypothetical protein
MTDDSEAMEAARKEAEAVETQTKLFHGLKFFLGREVTVSSLCSCTLRRNSWTNDSSLLLHAIHSLFSDGEF